MTEETPSLKSCVHVTPVAQKTRSDPWVSDNRSGILDLLGLSQDSDTGKDRRSG